MKRYYIHFAILLVLIFTISFTTIESLNSINAQVNPSQEQIEPIPPSNNTNTNQTTPIVISDNINQN